ncbi:MAG TPA: hypothetical protein PKY81_00245 [bacterium]|mgnify:CR=1 FL=1|nr:hypothetical protein [bacterium]
MKKILNITFARKELLKITENLKKGENIILTKDNSPVAVVSSIGDFEKNIFLNRKINIRRNSALIIVAAKECDNRTALKALREINDVIASVENPYSKIIFVYGEKTEDYLSKINCDFVYAVENEKYNLPLITSIKRAMSGLLNEDFFVLTFLSRITLKSDLIETAQKAASSSKGIVIKQKNNKPSHPVSFSIKYKKYFLSTRKELGVPYLIKKFENDIEYID